MINLSYEGTPNGLMEYLAKEASYDTAIEDMTPWQDRPEYDEFGNPNE